MDLYTVLITFIILIFSAVVHEVAHGLAAEYFGDSTARDSGRITLNPIPHIDLFGSIMLPLLLLLAGSPIIFGAAKPVPVDFESLRPRRLGMIMVSLAGPMSNFFLAIALGLILKYGSIVHAINFVSAPILLQAALINLVLGTFNLIPIPPLDGSKVLVALAPDRWVYQLLRLEQFGFLLVLLFLYTGLLQRILLPVIRLYGRIFGMDFLG